MKLVPVPQLSGSMSLAAWPTVPDETLGPTVQGWDQVAQLKGGCRVKRRLLGGPKEVQLKVYLLL